MKKLTSILSIGALSWAMAANITAVKVDGDLTGDKWGNAKYSEVLLYPQTTLTFNDKEAVEENKNRKAKKAMVAAIYNGKEIAFNVKWADKSKNTQKSNAIKAFGDGVALQIPTDYSNPDTLPYIGMGSKGRSVIVHLQKSAEPLFEPNGNGDISHQRDSSNVNVYNDEMSGRDGLTKFNEKVSSSSKSSYERSFIAEGFRSTTEIKDATSSFKGAMTYEEPYFFGLFGEEQWNATFTRDLQDSYIDLKDAFPIALAIWDGEKKGRDGLKHLSSWLSVELQEGKAEALDKTLASSKGDITKGKELALANCAACHNYGENNSMPMYMAPNLSNIGGYSTPAYIKESMIAPNAVVVPGYNRNAHPNFPWYNLDGKKRVSTMPDYSWLAPEEVDAIVAYFSTLKADKEEVK